MKIVHAVVLPLLLCLSFASAAPNPRAVIPPVILVPGTAAARSRPN
jgi:hypothetical protein